VWFGQIISLIGTNMSTFALTIWVYERTGSATALAFGGLLLHHPNADHQPRCRSTGRPLQPPAS